MEKRRSAPPRLLAAMLCALLTACETVSSVVGITPEQSPTDACPPFGRMNDVERMVRFSGAVGDPAAALFDARIIDVAAACDLDGVEFSVAAGMRVSARAGPAWRGGPLEVPVVIAQVSGERQLLYRRTDVVVLNPAQGASRAEGDFTVEYSLILDEPGALGDDRIVFGLRPTRAELQYIRQR